MDPSAPRKGEKLLRRQCRFASADFFSWKPVFRKEVPRTHACVIHSLASNPDYPSDLTGAGSRRRLSLFFAGRDAILRNPLRDFLRRVFFPYCPIFFN
jgi:hypothetical protein